MGRIDDLEHKINNINSNSENEKLNERIEKIEKFLKKELWYNPSKIYRNSEN